jgi:FxsC-like protein
MTADKFRDVLAAAGLPATTRTLEECLWLACHIPAGVPEASGAASGRDQRLGETDQTDGETRHSRPGQELPPVGKPSQLSGALHITSPRSGTPSSVQSVQVPAAAMLGQPLAVQRSLRPLKRRIADSRRKVLDEELTAVRIADTGRWIPVLTGAPQRWLDLALVVDTGPSMWLWRPLVHELRMTLGQVGAFRDVRVVYFAGGQIVNANGTQARHPATLVDPAGRRAVLVLSDCSGASWWQGKAAAAIRVWARRGPTAILQPLPEQMWQRTAAPAVPGWAGYRQPGAPNTALIFTPDTTGSPLTTDVIPVPVLEIAPLWLSDWAKLVADPGYGAIRTAATCLPPGPSAPAKRVQQELTLNVTDRVWRFRAAASPEAVRLAAYIAVSTPALPVMRLIQRALLRDSRPSHLAEVLLSGLLRPTARDRYEFVDEEARKGLLAALPRSESWHAVNVLRQVSAEIERHAGTAAATFPALLEINRPAASTDGAPFALVSPAAVAALSSLAVPIRSRVAQRPHLALGGTGAKRRPAETSPVFFLSYARTPRYDRDSAIDPDVWVHKLYDDLSFEVLQFTRSPIAGFMDREVRLGMRWSEELSTALATCQVFVPLYSPRYFASDNCGKEWYAFSKRVLDQRARQPRTQMAIVPALWAPVGEDNLPDMAKGIQFNHHSLGDMYGRVGFSGIMKVHRFHDDYMLAVQGLARRIVEVANQARIDPAWHTGYDASESAFGGSGVHEMAEKRMQLAVVTLDAGHLPDGRSEHYYGRTPLEWRPYFPTSSMPIVDYASELALYLGCQPRVVTLEDHLNDVAKGVNAPSLFLIDAWAAMSQRGRDDLRRLDELDQGWTSVLFPWNQADDQTVTAGGQLRENLESCLPRKLASIPPRLLRHALEVETIEDFGDVMAPMIMAMRRRFLRKSAPKLPAATEIERPRLRARSDYDDEGSL